MAIWIIPSVVIFIIIWPRFDAGAYEIKGMEMSQYYSLPKLHVFDRYDECMSENHEFEKIYYCIADVLIKPDASNKLWNLIEVLSNDTKHNFRHDHLLRGLCINRCKKSMSKYNHSSRSSYYQEKFIDHPILPLDFDTFRDAIYYKSKFDHLATECVNQELKEKYGLVGYAEIEYCIEKNENFPFDGWDITFMVMVFLLMSVTLFSTIFDFVLKRQYSKYKNDPDYYKKPLKTPLQQKLTIFSIQRNNHKIFQESESAEARELKSLHALKFLTCFCVIAGHTILFYGASPLANPEYIEGNFHRPVTIILRNGVLVTQTYIFLSGFLSAVNLVGHFSRKKSVGVAKFFGIAVFRYLRFLPVYGFVIMFSATLLVHVQDGPVWKRSGETNRYFCRKNWWANLLLINNYVTTSEPCVLQSWFLSTDFQLFLVGILFLMVLFKFPRTKNLLFAMGSLVSFLVPAVTIYLNKFEGITLFPPESQRTVMWYDENYLKNYIPAHTNGGCYFIGLVCGCLYKQIKMNNIDMKRIKTLKYLSYMAVPLGLCVIFSGEIFYTNDFEKPAVWIALYGTVTKNLWGLNQAVIVLGITFGHGYFVKDIFNMGVFRPLSRISFSVFLCHIEVLRILLGNTRSPFHIDDIAVTKTACCALFLSFILGYLLCLFIETPFATLQKFIFKFSPREDSTSNSKEFETSPNINNNIVV